MEETARLYSIIGFKHKYCWGYKWLCSTFLRHVHQIAWWKAHDRRQNENSAAEFALHPARLSRTRGTLHIYNNIVYDIVHDIPKLCLISGMICVTCPLIWFVFWPEHCHIDFIKKIAHCTNNKEVFFTILRYHVREGHLQYLLKLRTDLCGKDDEAGDDTIQRLEAEKKKSQKNDSISCDLGLRYPLVQSIFAGRKNHQTLQVSAYCSTYST